MDLHIKDVLKNYIKKDKVVGDAYYSQKVRLYWKENLSESITSRTHDLTFTKGKLIIRTRSAPLRNELFNAREELRKKINDFLGDEIINVIELG